MSASTSPSTESTESDTTTQSTADPGAGHQQNSGDAMTAARPPVGTGLSPLVGILLALGLIGVGVVGVEEALIRSGAVSGTSWTGWVLARLDGVRPVSWMVVTFVAVALLGLLLLLVGVRRRPRKAIALRASTGVFLRTHDLAEIAEHRVEGADGVTDVHASATRGRLKVMVTTVDDKVHNGALGDVVRQRLAASLGAIEQAPKVDVDIRNEDLR